MILGIIATTRFDSTIVRVLKKSIAKQLSPAACPSHSFVCQFVPLSASPFGSYLGDPWFDHACCMQHACMHTSHGMPFQFNSIQFNSCPWSWSHHAILAITLLRDRYLLTSRPNPASSGNKSGNSSGAKIAPYCSNGKSKGSPRFGCVWSDLISY